MPAKKPAAQSGNQSGAQATGSADDKGLKRICPSCGTRYYDLGKRPIICPNCATEFTGEAKVKAKRGRAVPLADEDEDVSTENGPDTARKPGDEETEEAESDADTVSLEEVESMEAGDDDAEDTLDEDLDDDDLDADLDEATDLGDDDKDL